MSKVVSVVVTYNRLEYLKICLIKLSQQTHPIEKIYLIDNASTDGTLDWVNKYALRDYSNLKYIRLNENIGGSGGFNEGFRHASKEKFDYLWLMDDDVAPDKECLEYLLLDAPIDGVIHPTRYYIDGEIFYWHHWLDPLTMNKIPTNIEMHLNYLASTNVACFEGALISNSVISKIGYPERHYFICEDDTLYGFLASLSYPVLYTSRARLMRQIKSNGKNADWKLYYIFRNRLLCNTRIKAALIPSVKANAYSFLFLWLWIVIDMFRYVRSFRGLLISCKGIWHGLKTAKLF